jgi:hypothetical protein
MAATAMTVLAGLRKEYLLTAIGDYIEVSI